MSKWTTLGGKTKDFEDLDDQHLSNIFWYHKIVAPNLTIRLKVLTEFMRRYPDSQHGRDKVLHYEPRMSEEIHWLESHGYLLDKGKGFREVVELSKENGYTVIGVCPTNATIALLREIDNIKDEIGL